MRTPMLLGLLAGLGLWAVVRGLVRAERPLASALEAVGQTRSAGSVSALNSFTEQLGSSIMSVIGTDLGNLRADLALVGRSEEYHLIQRLRTALIYSLLPVSFWLVTVSAGVAFLPLSLSLAAGCFFAVAGWLLTDSQLRKRAARRREEFSAALVAYLQLVSILLAGGAGIGESLNSAVDYGEGHSFRIIRRCLTESRVRGVSPWVAMRDAGERLKLDQLVDLASTMELAGVSGAHVRESLVARARAFRTHEMNAIEREAETRSVAMSGPTAFMVGGFVVLIGYPAFDVILSI